MQLLKCKRRGIYDIGFIDPYYIHEKTISGFSGKNKQQQAIDTENNLVKALRFHETKREILFPYNFQ